jgi:phosphoglycerol transferase
MAKKRRNKSGNPAAGSVQSMPGVKPATPVAQSTYSVAGSTKAASGFFTTAWFEWLSISLASALSFWFLTSRIFGVQVSVLADEYLYLLDAHYKGLSEGTYPNYLFQWIYSSTKMCGADFYSCARGLNAFFVIFGAVFIYLLAKHIGRSKFLAGLAAVAAILGSYGTYTAYFMPEAIFNGLMMVFFWAIIRFGKTDNLLVWAAIGSSLGIASLAKPHGLFVVPAALIFIVLWTRATNDKWLTQAFLKSTVFLSGVVGVKYLFGYFLAGERALNLFGMYGTLTSVATRTAQVLSSPISEIKTGNVWLTSWGQILMVSMILGLSFLFAIIGLMQGLRKSEADFERVKFQVFYGLSIFSLMAASAIFEAYYTGEVWLHTRYYTYLLPLAFVVLISALKGKDQKLWPWVKFPSLAVFLGLAAINLVTAAAPYASNWIDAPDFRNYINNIPFSFLAILLSVLAALIWVWRSNAAIVLALVISITSSVFSGSVNTGFLKDTFGEEGGYEHIARILSGYIPQSETDRAVLVGQYEVLQRTAFSSLTGSLELRPPVEVLDKSDIDSSRSWLVTVGDQAVSGFEEPTIVGGGYKMYSLDPSNSTKPRTSTIESYSGACLGSNSQEWACGLETRISLNKAFSPNSRVDIILEVSENFAGQEFEFTLGDASLKGKLDGGVVGLSVKFSNSFEEEYLQIRVSGLSSSSQNQNQEFIRPIWASTKPAF